MTATTLNELEMEYYRAALDGTLSEDELPSGGSKGLVLSKKTSADGDVEWKKVADVNNSSFSTTANGTTIKGNKMDVTLPQLMQGKASMVAQNTVAGTRQDKPSVGVWFEDTANSNSAAVAWQNAYMSQNRIWPLMRRVLGDDEAIKPGYDRYVTDSITQDTTFTLEPLASFMPDVTFTVTNTESYKVIIKPTEGEKINNTVDSAIVLHGIGDYATFEHTGNSWIVSVCSSGEVITPEVASLTDRVDELTAEVEAMNIIIQDIQKQLAPVE